MVHWDNNMAERDVIIFGAWDSRHCVHGQCLSDRHSRRRQIRQMMKDPRQFPSFVHGRRGEYSPYRSINRSPRKNRFFSRVKRSRIDFIHGTTTLRVRSQVLFYFLTFLLPLSPSLSFSLSVWDSDFHRIFIYNTCKTMENKKWKLTQSITRYKYHKIEYYIYIFTLIWFTHGSSHPRLQVRHAWGWHVRGLNMSLLPLYHVVEVTYQEKN